MDVAARVLGVALPIFVVVGGAARLLTDATTSMAAVVAAIQAGVAVPGAGRLPVLVARHMAEVVARQSP